MILAANSTSEVVRQQKITNLYPAHNRFHLVASSFTFFHSRIKKGDKTYCAGGPFLNFSFSLFNPLIVKLGLKGIVATIS